MHTFRLGLLGAAVLMAVVGCGAPLLSDDRDASQTSFGAAQVRELERPTQDFGFGTQIPESKLALYSITVFPDGANLPNGRGSVGAGREVYRLQCAMCHGDHGEGGPASRLSGQDGFISLADPLRIARIQANPLIVYSAGAQWPYATSIFDYTRRAMPPYAPKSLSNDELYAVTAFVLYLNGIVEEDAELDRNGLLEVQMPGLARSVYAAELDD